MMMLMLMLLMLLLLFRNKRNAPAVHVPIGWRPASICISKYDVGRRNRNFIQLLNFRWIFGCATVAPLTQRHLPPIQDQIGSRSTFVFSGAAAAIANSILFKRMRIRAPDENPRDSHPAIDSAASDDRPPKNIKESCRISKNLEESGNGMPRKRMATMTINDDIITDGIKADAFN